MSRLSPVRAESMKAPEDLRRSINDIIRVVNESALRVAILKASSVQADRDVVLSTPGFNVGAVLLGGVNPTAGASVPTSAPWVSNWAQQMDGRITCRIGGLASFPALYAVSLVLIEDTGASR